MSNNTFTNYRPYLIYLISIIIIFVPFLIYVFNGWWEGQPNTCLLGGDDNCFCERVNIDMVNSGASGVRQPSNTWSNLYALGTALVVAIGISRDRIASRGKSADNLIKSDNLLADLYIFAVFFLGFGSMWFHASITQLGGMFDGMSMYVFVGYMTCYTLYRLIPKWWVFLPTYILIIALFTAIHNHVDSVYLIMINVAMYIILELIILTWRIIDWCKGKWSPPSDWYLPLIWWLSAVASFGLAYMFWVWGAREHDFCNPDSAWQWHGMWHVFAGIMTVFIYSYWRKVKPIKC